MTAFGVNEKKYPLIMYWQTLQSYCLQKYRLSWVFKKCDFKLIISIHGVGY